MMIWDSALFQKFPHGTELLVRLLMNGAIGRVLYLILNTLNPGISTTFKMFPFSTDPLYQQVNITTDDGSGMKHISNNGNLWFTCSCSNIKERSIMVTLPNR
jgi:hypothetical protein